MAGLTENTDLLTGLNQQIKAVNDLATIIATKSLSTTVNVSAGGCGCIPIGDTPLIDGPLSPEDDPPPGYTEVDVQIDERACKVANFSVEQLQLLINQLIIANVDSLIGLGISVAVAAILLVLPEAIVGVFVAGMLGKLGWLTNIVRILITETISLDDLATALETYYDDLVCAHYNAADTDEIIANVVEVLENNGVSAANVLLVEAILTVDWLAIQYFDWLDHPIDPLLDGYTAPYDCTGCETLEGCAANTGEYHLDAINTSSNYWWVYFGSTSFPQLGACCFTIDALTINNYPGLNPAFCGVYYSGCEGQSPTYGCQHVGPASNWNWGAIPSQVYDGGNGLNMRGDGGAWSIDITITDSPV